MTALFVPDCSLTMAWCFADEATPETDKVLDLLSQGAEAIVPGHWSLEVTNVLLGAERKKRLTQDKATQFLTLLETLPLSVDPDTAARGPTHTLALARETGLTSYDAAYLELAIRKGAALASLDGDLCAAAKSRGITVLGR
ncbi:hypothetical protein GobsT_25890 [Gemmata obscuriglobus]|uniref:PIN domain-containing protein n=1 Tax=Gemmata obscuriglobus TaxID=114 RepID=A0A2Z3HCY7_9BACT|nr:type II toxin-antitoxin system VapC family toxin [Gemmata obscuriglobus]AWM39130.1 PIN domain-containing protein [Gemmata obscuriglobus]QEG27825.1 hypothetical protein GobsT_25890 [Gemmata obscuriglobus]VTS05176.1 DNA-binding protein OS=Smithella sp. D17 GN=KD27_07745 PE=4 SV=1: PIN [Gemmata obscuriglobus UQM 2246]